MTATATGVQMPPCDHMPRPYTGPSRADVLAMRKQYINPAIFTIYREPLMIVAGHMQWLFDETGRRYLDMYAGIVTVSCGHCHPKITAAIKEQVDTIQHTTTIYLHPNIAKLAKKLASKMPPGLEVTYFVNSGSEANDLAIQMARLYTGNSDVIALRNAYHGTSSGTIGLTALNTWKYPLPNHGTVHHAPCPDPYRSAFPGTPEEIASASAREIRELIRYSTPGKVAAFIAEPIQGVGGATHGAPNYLREAYGIVREHGGLCIADEVQTGFGRAGAHFWMFEQQGVVPDIVTMGKPIGNGHPMGAVVTTPEIAASFANGMEYFNTFGGNPVSCAVGLAVLNVIRDEGLQENARNAGDYLLQRLKDLALHRPLIGDVRGLGLFLGIELVRNRKTQEPAAQEASDVVNRMKDLGVLLSTDGPHHNVIKIKPPLVFSCPDADKLIAGLGKALAR